MTYRLVQVGTGGIGAYWCRNLLPEFVADGRIEIVAAVDINPSALVHAQEGLGLEPDRCYTDLSKALDDHPADFCTVVVPPAFHEDVVDAAIEHDLHILSEKPIADTLAGSVRIARKAEAAERKMSVTMSHRFDQDKITFSREVEARRNGKLDYLVMRFTSPNRKRNSWGVFRHQMADPLMIEGAIHHLEFLVAVAGAPCVTVAARTWNPHWGEYAGDSQGLVLLEFQNDVKASYEGAKSTAVGLNSWGQEYTRAECEKATVIMNRRKIRRYGQEEGLGGEDGPVGEQIPLAEGNRWSHLWLIEQFLDWLDGGPPAPTEVSKNLHATAVMFSAIESSRRRQVVEVAEILAEAEDAV